MVHFIHQTIEDADKIRPSYSVSSIMAGAVTLHYVRFDRHQKIFLYFTDYSLLWLLPVMLWG